MAAGFGGCRLDLAIDLCEVLVHLHGAPVHLCEVLVHLREASVDVVQAIVNVLAERIEGSSQRVEGSVKLRIHGVILLQPKEVR